MSRTKAAEKNLIIGVFMQVFDFLLAWFARIAITRSFSASYLGINGLYNDILSVLSLSELGIGTAMLAALYEPAAKKDSDKVRAILNYYQKLYLFVAGCIAAAGLLVMPLLPKIVKGFYGVDHPYLYYGMFLLETVLSYFCTWKNSLLYVHQEQYIGSFWNGLFQFIRYGLQFLLLVTTGNFFLFVLVQVACAFLPGFVTSIQTQKRYPEEITAAGQKRKYPDAKEKRVLRSGIGAMSMHKVGGVLVNNTDSLIMSAFLGLSSVGIYSNYRLVINTLTHFMKQCVDSVTGGVGNLSVTEDGEKVYGVYREIYLLSVLGYGFCTAMMAVLFPDYILTGFDKRYLLDSGTTILIIADFYTKGMRVPLLTFRDAAGLFRYDRYKPIFEIIINLVTSILLVQKHGIAGIVLGTLISFFATSFWVDPLVLFKEGIRTGWKKKYARYFGEYALNSGILILEIFVLRAALSIIGHNGAVSLVLKGVLGSVLYAGMSTLFYGWRKESRILLQRLKKHGNSAYLWKTRN